MLIKILKKMNGISEQRGSHLQFRNDIKSGKVTVPNHKGDIPIGTLKTKLKGVL